MKINNQAARRETLTTSYFINSFFNQVSERFYNAQIEKDNILRLLSHETQAAVEVAIEVGFIDRVEKADSLNSLSDAAPEGLGLDAIDLFIVQDEGDTRGAQLLRFFWLQCVLARCEATQQQFAPWYWLKMGDKRAVDLSDEAVRETFSESFLTIVDGCDLTRRDWLDSNLTIDDVYNAICE